MSFDATVQPLVDATTELLKEVTTALREDRATYKLDLHEIERWRRSVTRALAKAGSLHEDLGHDDWYGLKELKDELDHIYAAKVGHDRPEKAPGS